MKKFDTETYFSLQDIQNMKDKGERTIRTAALFNWYKEAIHPHEDEFLGTLFKAARVNLEELRD